MALLDVTSILTDADISDVFTVQRRQETIDANGWGQQSSVSFVAIGVITAVSPNDLQRAENYQALTRSISVVTKFALRGATAGYQSDVVVWKGSRFLVKHVDLYPHFGPGFFQAECSSMTTQDGAAEPLDAHPQIAFNLASNSNYIPIL